MTKQEIRLLMKEKKLNLSQDYIDRESNIIINKVLNHVCYKNADVIYTYVSFNQEVKTHDFIKTALKENKLVAVPKVCGEEIMFFYINNLELLDESKLGILEPEKEIEAIPDLLSRESNILVIVPGLAFDRAKNRMGYGKGYYDRFFAKYSHVTMKKVALTFDFQVLDQIPTSKDDILMDEIITQSWNMI